MKKSDKMRIKQEKMRIKQKKYELKEQFLKLKEEIALKEEEHLISEEEAEKMEDELYMKEKGKKKVFAFIAKHVTVENYDSVKYILADLPGAEKLKPICTYADQQITLRDFVPFLIRHREMKFQEGVLSFLNERWPVFFQAAMMEYEDQHLETKYPEFKSLMDEFHDGMILYEINSQKVWMKAIEDTTGLNNFYEQTKNQYPTDPAIGNLEPMPLADVRSAVITEYQKYLDEQWIQELKRKYPVQVYDAVFNAILSKK